jgi:HEAT repeat protein
MVVLGAEREAIGFDPAFAAERNSAWLRQNGYGSPAGLADGRVAAISNHGLVISGLADSGRFAFEKAAGGYVPYDIAPLPDGRMVCTGTTRGWIGVMELDSGKIARIFSLDQIHSVRYLGERPRPPVIPTDIKPVDSQRPNKTGFLLCQSVFGTKQTNADLGRIKAVRIIEGKPFTLRSAKHRFVHLGVEGIELGTVPLAPDGSFYVEVPADRALAIQAIDAEGRSVINETSWLYVRPGETRSCVGCHNGRTLAPDKSINPLAARFDPVSLTGKGAPHRFRANNAGNGGVLNLQFDRFREAGAINLHHVNCSPARLSGLQSDDSARLCKIIAGASSGENISAIQQLAILRDHSSAATLADALRSSSSDVRLNAAVALAACADRTSVEPLLKVLDDRNPFVSQAANMALENITNHSVSFNAFDAEQQKAMSGLWRRYFQSNDFDSIESALIGRLSSDDPVTVYKTIEALGHIGSQRAGKAVREYLSSRLDSNLRISIAAMRTLGQLRDVDSVELLVKILDDNMLKDPGSAPDLHELGWQQKPVYLAATAAEALGRIGTDTAEKALVERFTKLHDFWTYTNWTGDHTWLMGCHSSVLHFRIIEALDRMATTPPLPVVVTALKSVPIDTDRALLFETDSCENLTARLVNRSPFANDVIETCLAVLGDASAKSSENLKDAVTASPPAVSVLPQDAWSRAAQILSVVCIDNDFAPRVRSAFDRWRATEPSRTRSWVCFFLARLLGKLHDEGSVPSLIAALHDDAAEASFGFEDQPNVFVYKAMTPFYRAAAAHALGQIAAPESADVLLRTVADFDNALSVRDAAASALGAFDSPTVRLRLRMLAADYPEVSVRRSLQQAQQPAAAGTKVSLR